MAKKREISKQIMRHFMSMLDLGNNIRRMVMSDEDRARCKANSRMLAGKFKNRVKLNKEVR